MFLGRLCSSSEFIKYCANYGEHTGNAIFLVLIQRLITVVLSCRHVKTLIMHVMRFKGALWLKFVYLYNLSE